ncbi:hypothetical protein KAH94_04025 [bacterium]|nr:hypothetical protein [bacterium]
MKSIKKIITFAILFALYNATSTTQAWLNKTHVYLVNKSNRPIKIGPIVQHNYRNEKILQKGTLTVPPLASSPSKTKTKLFTIDRDQGLYMQNQARRTDVTTSIDNRSLNIVSTARGGMPSVLLIYLNNEKINPKKGYNKNNIKIYSYYQFGQLYHNIDIVFY